MRSGHTFPGKELVGKHGVLESFECGSAPGGRGIPSTMSIFCLIVFSRVRDWSADTLGGMHDQPHQQPASGWLWEQPASRSHSM